MFKSVFPLSMHHAGECPCCTFVTYSKLQYLVKFTGGNLIYEILTRHILGTTLLSTSWCSWDKIIKMANLLSMNLPLQQLNGLDMTILERGVCMMTVHAEVSQLITISAQSYCRLKSRAILPKHWNATYIANEFSRRPGGQYLCYNYFQLAILRCYTWTVRTPSR